MVPSQKSSTVSFADTVPVSMIPKLSPNMGGAPSLPGTTSPTSTTYGASSSLSSTVKVIRNLSVPPLKTASPPASTVRPVRSAQPVVGIVRSAKQTKLRKKRKFAFLMDCFWAAFFAGWITHPLRFVSGMFLVNSVLELETGWLLQAAAYIYLFFDTRFSLLVASPKILKENRSQQSAVSIPHSESYKRLPACGYPLLD